MWTFKKIYLIAQQTLRPPSVLVDKTQTLEDFLLLTVRLEHRDNLIYWNNAIKQTPQTQLLVSLTLMNIIWVTSWKTTFFLWVDVDYKKNDHMASLGKQRENTKFGPYKNMFCKWLVLTQVIELIQHYICVCACFHASVHACDFDQHALNSSS